MDGFLWSPTEAYGFLQIIMGSCGFLGIPMGSQGFLWIPMCGLFYSFMYVIGLCYHTSKSDTQRHMFYNSSLQVINCIPVVARQVPNRCAGEKALSRQH